MRRAAVLGLLLALLVAPVAGASVPRTVALTYRDALYDPAGKPPGQAYGALTHTFGGATNIVAPGGGLRIAWSPDGLRVAVQVDRDLVMADPDGTNRTVISGSSGYSPSFSPDGARIAYVGFAPGTSERGPLGDVYTVGVDGSNPQLVMAGQAVQSVSWSRDDRLAVATFAGGAPGIHVVGPDGSGDRLLAPGYYNVVQWARDGRRLLALQGIARPRIVVIDARTGRLRKLNIRTTAATWTPDGRIAYLDVAPLGETVLRVAHADGRGRRKTYALPQPALDARDYLDVAWRPQD